MSIEISKIKVSPLPPPGECVECYLIHENDRTRPIPKKYTDMPIHHQFSNQAHDTLLTSDQLDVSLPDLIIPENPTLDSLNKFYLACLQGTRVLPLYIRNIWNTTRDQSQSEEYFRKLQQIFVCLPPIDYSFLSPSTNAFIDSFKGMVNRLKKAGITLRSLPATCNVEKEESAQDFIQIPEPDPLNLPASQWSTSTRPISNLYQLDVPHLTQERLDLLENPNNEETSLPEMNNEENNEDMNDGFTTINDGINLADNIQLANYVRGMEQKSDDEDEEEEKAENEGGEEKQPHKALILISQEAATMTIQAEKFDGLAENFKEIEGIERAIRRMKEMKKGSILKVSTGEENIIEEKYFRPNKQEFPIIELVNQSMHLASLLIRAASNQSVPFSNIAVNILVDCSSFISIENKLFNMMIVCSLTYALASLEIPYSVAVTSDAKFRCVIKKYDEPHSIPVLQRILDCLLIKRFRTRLANSLKYAIDYMEYPDPSRPYRAFFTLSDGLDENLILTKGWSNYIFTNPHHSFGFVFIKSNQLVGNNLMFVENVWSTFENDIKQFNSQSAVKVSSIIAETSQDVFNNITDMFGFIMKRAANQQLPLANASHINPDIQERLPDLESINAFVHFNSSKFDEHKSIFIQKNVVHNVSNRIDRLDTSIFRNKLNKICACSASDKIQNEYSMFIHQFIGSKKQINHSTLESIFHPNKASQSVLSNTGTDFDITALILNLINPMPDPLIYLEEKGGLIRNYGVTVVIDSSSSCFNELSGSHTLQTIKVLLTSLSALDLPCFDLIVSTESAPKILCSEVGTLRALHEKSPLWESLFSVLSLNSVTADLGSAIHAAFDLRRMRSTEYTSLLFVVTDGLYQENESQRILEYLNMCLQCGINTFGIGVGIYPIGITRLFSQAIMAPNPSTLMRGIASFFGDDLADTLSDIRLICSLPPDNAALKNIFEKLIKKENDPTFADLKKALHEIPTDLDAFDEFYNEEQDVIDSNKGFINPEGSNTELYVKDLLKGQKILIVMLWTCEMSSKEKEFTHPRYINTPYKGQTECIRSCVSHYGIDLTVVTNYKDAIRELTRQTRPGSCDYYATWVLCGPQYAVLPPPATEMDAHLVGQFNECLIKFWNAGGSIVFWAEGSGLCYQVNLFLETAVFPGGKKSKLRISKDNEHPGEKILVGDNSGDLKTPMTFNRSPLNFKKSARPSIAHNLGKIFEGVTIAYAENESDMSPFTPFSRDSSGGISSLYYPADTSALNGDIIIDCGYTKLFTEMHKDGTFRYVQNIAGWTARPEYVRVLYKGVQPHEWRPKSISQTIQEGVQWPHFIPKPVIPTINPKSLVTLFAVDASGSVMGVDLYHTETAKIINEFYKPGDQIALWGSRWGFISRDQMRQFNNTKGSGQDHGGTESSLVAEIARSAGKNYWGHLVLITDGCVNGGAIARSDNLMRQYGIQFKYVTTFVITGSGGDLSVGIPYCRGCPYQTYQVRNYGERKPTLSLSQADQAAMDSLPRINSYQQFINNYDALNRAIISQTVGTAGVTSIANSLTALRTRVINSGMQGNQQADFDSKWRPLYNMSTGAIHNAFTLDSIAAAAK